MTVKNSAALDGVGCVLGRSRIASSVIKRCVPLLTAADTVVVEPSYLIRY